MPLADEPQIGVDIASDRRSPVSGRPPGAGPDATTSVHSARSRWRYDIPKRVLDLVVATAVLVLTAPVVVCAAAMIKLTSRGPVIHRAQRVGRHGEQFTMFKLRTMHVGADDAEQRDFNRRELLGELGDVEEFSLGNDPRITRIGRLLRAVSIDELPQLVNVLRGDMSLVGPRPSIQWEVDLFEPRFRRREMVLPGITGLWQVSGRRQIDMRGMLELDLEYVDSRTFALDLVILARTLPAVVKTTGAS